MKGFYISIIMISICATSCFAQISQEVHFEQVALDHLFESTVLDSLENTIFFEDFFNRFSESTKLYGGDQTCGITMIGQAEEIENYESFFKDFRAKRDTTFSTDLSLPSFVANLSWSKFKSEREKYQGYYLFVRNAITNGKEHIVQISLIDGKVLVNSIDIILLISGEGIVKKHLTSFNSTYYLEDNKCK